MSVVSFLRHGTAMEEQADKEAVAIVVKQAEMDVACCYCGGAARGREQYRQ